MDTMAVVLEGPQRIALRRLDLAPPGPEDVVVEIEWSGISTGTERLLYDGRMPSFPGMGYPLVPGYESVGRVRAAGESASRAVGDFVFVPGAACYREAKGLFGGAARRVVTPARRTIAIPEQLGRDGVLLALAATAYHAIVQGAHAPDLIVGHGVLGRLLSRIAIALGAPAPTVYEISPARRIGGQGYRVTTPDEDERRDYRAICDASGAHGILDALVPRLARGGEICLAGFYEQPVAFAFPPAFMREARIRIAAEFTPQDLAGTVALIERGALRLDGLITHTSDAKDAAHAYGAAFRDVACLKMALDWRGCA